MGGVLTTRRVASVPLTPTRTVPQTSPTAHTQGSSVNCSENSRRASTQPMAGGAEGRQRAGEKTQRGKFGGDALQHRAAARAQGTQHGALVAALVPRRLHRRQQHHDSGRQRE